MPFFSTNITPTTAPQPLMANKPLIQRVKQISISVRSMGTASYIAVGGQDSQDKRFTSTGSGMSISPIGEEKSVDITTIRIVSDTADAVVDIFGEST